MDGIVSFGKKRTYEEFKNQIPNNVIELFEKLRDFSLSLGKNVIEDVRMHRIVFGKSMTFRWFADLEPQNDHIIVKIQRDRKEMPKIFQVKTLDDVKNLQSILQNAYETIH